MPHNDILYNIIDLPVMMQGHIACSWVCATANGLCSCFLSFLLLTSAWGMASQTDNTICRLDAACILSDDHFCLAYALLCH